MTLREKYITIKLQGRLPCLLFTINVKSGIQPKPPEDRPRGLSLFYAIKSMVCEDLFLKSGLGTKKIVILELFIEEKWRKRQKSSMDFSFDNQTENI